MHSPRIQRFFRLGMVAALVAAVFAAGLLGNQGNRALAQDTHHQTYMIQAGAFGAANFELLAFAPNSLKVHRGDTVMWHFNSFHNVHLGEDKAADLVIAPDVDGKPLPQLNPAVVFPTVKPGDTYQGGDANTGLPLDPSAPSSFALVIDLAPGNYLYFCDVHPGMVGNIEVVDEATAIPSPIEVAAAGAQEITDQLNKASLALADIMQKAPTASDNGKVDISAGSGAGGRVSPQAFFSPLVTVHVGDSVTWTIAADSVEPHTITSSNFVGELFNPMEQKNGPPVLALGPVFMPGEKTAIGASDIFNSGFLTPGQSFTLTFTEPGVHAYGCRLHPGMFGAVVVAPAM